MLHAHFPSALMDLSPARDIMILFSYGRYARTLAMSHLALSRSLGPARPVRPRALAQAHKPHTAELCLIHDARITNFCAICLRTDAAGETASACSSAEASTAELNEMKYATLTSLFKLHLKTIARSFAKQEEQKPEQKP